MDRSIEGGLVVDRIDGLAGVRITLNVVLPGKGVRLGVVGMLEAGDARCFVEAEFLLV